MEVLLALGSAVAYGASDFTGGILTRRVPVFAVLLFSQLVSAALLLAALPLVFAGFSPSALRWGAAAGVAGFAGAALLYRGLARGRMSTVAPIAGLVSASLPAAFGLATGERPTALALLGVVLGLVAVVVISGAPQPSSVGATAGPARTRDGGPLGVGDALGAGAGFGAFFILLERAPAASGLWPLVGMRLSLLASALLAGLATRAPMRAAGASTWMLVSLGCLNVAADFLYLLATRRGFLSLVAVITSLYPGATVLLARVVLKERLAAQQLWGLVLAAISVILIVSGLE